MELYPKPVLIAIRPMRVPFRYHTGRVVLEGFLEQMVVGFDGRVFQDIRIDLYFIAGCK